MNNVENESSITDFLCLVFSINHCHTPCIHFLSSNYNFCKKMKMQVATSATQAESEPEDDIIRFKKSLKELKALQSQLHYAADYCETAFLNTKQKKIAVEDTKEYICKALVTVVDHLGSVSANLNCLISTTMPVSEVELRVDTLKNRVMLCEEYGNKLALSNLRWNPMLPMYHTRYLSTRRIDKNMVDLKSTSSSKQPSEIAKAESASVAAVSLSVRDRRSKGPNSAFHFQLATEKHRHNTLFGSDKLSLILRTRRR